MKIRNEEASDAEAIGLLTSEAFMNAAHSDGNEAQVVADLRRAGALTISLVATNEASGLIGHIAFSPVQIDQVSGGWFALGPVSIRPASQRAGIGRALILEGLHRLKILGADGCVLLGDPAYYQRFGFAVGKELTYYRRPNPYLQWKVLNGTLARGDVTFHSAFNPK
ncbi:MAG: N-acetyltransferase [Hyphomicrobiales bacterium]|nr:MAG: N-acetyltransferase [Hyphomicrobiales bacterium]